MKMQPLVPEGNSNEAMLLLVTTIERSNAIIR